MRPHPLPGLHLSRLGLLAAGLALLALAAWVRLEGAAQQAAAKSANPPLVADRKARNPASIVLLPHERGVVGWISGTRNYSGQMVTVSDGPRETQVEVEPGGFFHYAVQVARPMTLTFRLGGMKSDVELQPQGKLPPPSVFFVLDRSVYRPGQALRLAAFLRALDRKGDFVPLPDRPVELLLRSDAKQTVAARLRCRSDEQGRIRAEYTFTESDPLDQYTLSIAGFRGTAQLSLAEYRKTPMRLTMERQRQGGELRLRLHARDYLGQPVAGGKVQLSLQVIHDPTPPSRQEMNTAAFVYAGSGSTRLRPELLGLEETLLAEAADENQPVIGLEPQSRTVVKKLQGEVKLNASGEGTFTLSLRPKWWQQRHVVAVQAVLTDATGREVRKSQTMAIGDEDEDLRLVVPRGPFAPHDPIRVRLCDREGKKLKSSGTMVVMRLSTSRALSWPPAGVPGGMRHLGPAPVPREEWFRRTLVTAVPFHGDTATIKLNDPGAYVLVAMVTQPDGTPVRKEAGCVVQRAEHRPALELQLDRDTWTAQEKLTGTIFSRYADARVLLLLRDSRGIQMAWTQTLADGMAPIKQKLPAGLRYGCCVEAQYCDDLDGPAHVASRLIHVLPQDRMLTIQSRVEPVVEPGEKVAVDLEVNRAEPVDLVVSVYDDALRTIAADHSQDIRDFYLADDRVRQTQAQEVLRRRLNDATVGQLLSLAEKLLAEKKKTGEEGDALKQAVGLARKYSQLGTLDVVTLLRLAGVPVRHVSNEHLWRLPEGRPLGKFPVAELFSPQQDGWQLRVGLVNDTFMLGEYHPQQRPNPWQSPAVHGDSFVGWPFATGTMMGMTGMGMNGGLMGGFQGRGNLGVTGGMVGFGGGIQGGLGGGFNQMGARGGMGMMGMGGGMMGMMGGGMPMMGGMNLPQQPRAAARPSYVAHLPALAKALDDTDDGPPVQVRRRFSDSAFWNAKIRTDARGKARVEVPAPESLTTWRVVVTAVSRQMHVGQHTTSFRTARALMLHPLVPRFIVEGDRAWVAALVHNNGDAECTARVQLEAQRIEIDGPAEKEIKVPPRSRATVTWMVRAKLAGEGRLQISARGQGAGDAALEKIPIVKGGAEHVRTFSGFCNRPIEFAVPEGVDPKTVRLEARFMPALTADLVDSLDYLVEYPYGCVEQTMSRFLPAIKVAQILAGRHLPEGKLKEKLPAVVQAGIARLLHFQHKDGGWGWYEMDATHPIMTPYALYGLIEAEKAGYPIPNQDAIPRGLQRLREYIGSSDNLPTANRIYCMYVFGQREPLESGWWDLIRDWLKTDELTDYALALALELAARNQQPKLAGRLADRLHARARKRDGLVHWQTAGLSLWADDPFEVTAAVLKALVAHDPNDPLLAATIRFFMATKRGSHWNSTRDTAMILYALCDYLAKQQAHLQDAPKIQVRCNDGPAVAVPFAGVNEPASVVIPAEQLHQGDNTLSFVENRPQVLYRLVLRYWEEGRNLGPESNGLHVRRTFWLLDEQGRRKRLLKSGDAVRRGSYLESEVTVEPVDPGTPLRYLVVENRKPAGCEVVPASDERFDVKGSSCLLREDRDRWVAFHHLHSDGPVADRCVLLTEMDGDFLVPAAHAEMMYQTDVHGHSGTFTLRVLDKEGD